MKDEHELFYELEHLLWSTTDRALLWGFPGYRVATALADKVRLVFHLLFRFEVCKRLLIQSVMDFFNLVTKNALL